MLGASLGRAGPKTKRAWPGTVQRLGHTSIVYQDFGSRSSANQHNKSAGGSGGIKGKSHQTSTDYHASRPPQRSRSPKPNSGKPANSDRTPQGKGKSAGKGSKKGDRKHY